MPEDVVSWQWTPRFHVGLGCAVSNAIPRVPHKTSGRNRHLFPGTTAQRAYCESQLDPSPCRPHSARGRERGTRGNRRTVVGAPAPGLARPPPFCGSTSLNFRARPVLARVRRRRRRFARVRKGKCQEGNDRERFPQRGSGGPSPLPTKGMPSMGHSSVPTPWRVMARTASRVASGSSIQRR